MLGLNFAVGVVTRFQWNFSSGELGVVFKVFGQGIGQTLAMEGMFAFFLESALVGALVWGSVWARVILPGCTRRGRRAGCRLFHPRYQRLYPWSAMRLLRAALWNSDIGAYLFNPWAIICS